jgi:drug/metabolite transporter (DMT)-like permease
VTAGLLCAAGAALCYGVASVLQALSAARAAAAAGLDPRLLVRLARQLPYVAGLALDAAGFALAVLALRTLPLFLVQSVVAGSVGVTAVTGSLFLGSRLRRGESIALAALMCGLVLLAVAARPGHATPLSRWASWLLVGSAGVLAVIAAVVARWRRGTAVALAALAGAGFAGVGIAARGLPTPRPFWHVVEQPAAWALVAFGGLAILLFATALQRGAVTAVSAVMFAVETIVPAVVGLAWLGDATRPGIGPPMAVAGFALALAAAVALAPYAEPQLPELRSSQ